MIGVEGEWDAGGEIVCDRQRARAREDLALALAAQPVRDEPVQTAAPEPAPRPPPEPDSEQRDPSDTCGWFATLVCELLELRARELESEEPLGRAYVGGMRWLAERLLTAAEIRRQSEDPKRMARALAGMQRSAEARTASVGSAGAAAAEREGGRDGHPAEE